MKLAPAGGMVHLIGVSLPRSGHHFFENLLRNYLGEKRFGYCSEAGHDRCCGQVICPRAGDVEIFLRKSHDYGLDIPTDLPKVFYLVQHREPAARVQSALELIGRNDPNFDLNDRDSLEFWFAREAQYVINFYRKWIEKPPSNAIVVDYDGLVSTPSEIAEKLFDKLGRRFSRDEFETAIAPLRQYKAEARGVSASTETMRPRDARESALPLDMVADFDSLVRRHCPTAGWAASVLPHKGEGGISHAYRKMEEEKGWSDRQLSLSARKEAHTSNPHLGWHLIKRLKQRSMDEAAYQACEILAQRGFALAAGRLGEMAYDASRICMGAGELNKAVRLAQQAIEHEPRPDYERHLNGLLAARVKLADGTWETAAKVRGWAEAAAVSRDFDEAVKWYGLLYLAGKHEAAYLKRDELQLRLAKVLINAGKPAAAESELSRLLEETPENAEALFYRASAWHQLGRREEALQDIGRAVELNAGVSAYWRRMGQLLVACGRPSEGVTALTSALAIDPADSRAATALDQAKALIAKQGAIGKPN